jgi:Hsp70 protein
MKVPLALTLVRPHPLAPHRRPGTHAALTLLPGTTYSCVANYEGTNVEISEFCPLPLNVPFPFPCPTSHLPLRCGALPSSARNEWLHMRLLLTRSTVANEQGSFTTPSFVSFTDQERLIGEAAKNQAAMNPRNTVFDIKCVASDALYILPLKLTCC